MWGTQSNLKDLSFDRYGLIDDIRAAKGVVGLHTKALQQQRCSDCEDQESNFHYASPYEFDFIFVISSDFSGCDRQRRQNGRSLPADGHTPGRSPWSVWPPSP